MNISRTLLDMVYGLLITWDILACNLLFPTENDPPLLDSNIANPKIEQNGICVRSFSYLRRKAMTALRQPKSTHLCVDISSDLCAYEMSQ